MLFLYDLIYTFRQIQSLTLPSVSRLRDFTNSALTNILFYSSPFHQQVSTVYYTYSAFMQLLLKIHVDIV